jgi:peptidoglycan/LPS O-acetylase OafA/YrhL
MAEHAISADRASRERVHLDFLDGLRALAALFVVIHHAYIQVWNIFTHHYPVEPLNSATRWMIYGHLPVSVFIVLSGFCLMLPVVRGNGTLRSGARTFFAKRARRILPPYYFAIAFSLLTLFALYGRASAIDRWNLISHLLLIHNLSPNTIGGINGAFWSIAVEWQIYFLFPLLVSAWSRFGGWPTLAVTLVVSYGAWYAMRGCAWQGLTPHYAALFTFGMLGSALAFSPAPQWTAWRIRVPWAPVLALLTAALIAWCFRWGWETALGPLQALTDLLAGGCTVALLVLAALPGSNRMGRLLSARPLVFVGAFAYSVYLIHLPLLIVFHTLLTPLHLRPELAFGLLIGFGAPLIVGIAYLFHLAFERPFLTVRKSR